MIIYLDESGDLGFDWSKKKTSRYFVITLLVCEGKHVQTAFRKAVKRTLKNKLNRGKKKRFVHELKGEGTDISTKEYFYKHSPKAGWHIFSVSLNKARTQPHLQTKVGKKKLYNFLARFLLEKVQFPENLPALNLVLDRCKDTEEIRDFNQYVENQLEALSPLNTRLYITHEQSHENPGLQAVDMFCWGIARKNDRGDSAWYRMYQNKIRFETIYLPDLRA